MSQNENWKLKELPLSVDGNFLFKTEHFQTSAYCLTFQFNNPLGHPDLPGG